MRTIALQPIILAAVSAPNSMITARATQPTSLEGLVLGVSETWPRLSRATRLSKPTFVRRVE
jgi:hypothetical protein